MRTWSVVLPLLLGLAACGYESPGGTELTGGEGDAPPNANNESGKPNGGDPVNAESSGDRIGAATTPQAPAAPTPPTTTCDRTKAFGAPTPLLGLPALEHLSTPHLSADELAVYFTTSSSSGVAKLGRATRPAMNAPFKIDAALSALGSNAKDNDPTVAADDLTIWFSSERSGGQADLFFASRATRNDPFGVAQAVPVVNVAGAADNHPYFRARAQELWFSSQRHGSERSIFVAVKGGSGWQAPVQIKELGTNVRHPMVTEDGLDILFDADRPGGKGGTDLWQGRRASTGVPFGNLTPITAINTSANEFAGWMSPDGCRIYFSSDRELPERHRLFVAARP